MIEARGVEGWLETLGAEMKSRTSHNDALRRWISGLLERKGGFQHAYKLAAVALANKLARIVFAILRTDEVYDDRPVAA